MILAVDEVMKLPEFAVQNEKVIEEKLNAAELMIRAYTNNNFQNRFVRFTADSLGNRLLGTSDFLKVNDTVQISQSMVNDGLYTIRREKQGVYHLYGGCDYGRFGMCESNLCQDYERAGFRKRDWVD
jgi:hypothetical protein